MVTREGKVTLFRSVSKKRQDDFKPAILIVKKMNLLAHTDQAQLSRFDSAESVLMYNRVNLVIRM